MSYSVNKNNIILTRGDTFKAQVVIKDKSNNEYVPGDGDIIEFGVKKNFNQEEFLIKKTVPNDTLILRIEAEDTKGLPYGTYVWDMQLTKANGDVTTFITKASLTLTEEVC